MTETSSRRDVEPEVVPGPGQRFARSHAVVIGIDTYSGNVPPLVNAARDALRVGRALGVDHGFAVRGLLNGAATSTTLRRLVTEVLPAEVGPDDRLLIYVAGHGLTIASDGGPSGFLLFHDAVRDDPATFVSMRGLHDALAALPCRHFLLVLDCCFAGAFRWTRRDVGAPRPIFRETYDRYIASPAWQVVTSAAADQTAFDVFGGRADREGSSPFAAAMLDGLAGAADLDGDGLVTATELYWYVRRRVEDETEDAWLQTPGLFPLRRHERGEFVFQVPRARLALTPAPSLKPEHNPYRGLEPFDETSRGLFFGRERVVRKVARVVLQRRLTIVVGPSGSGKSSIVKAGLVPMFRTRAESAGRRRWSVVGPVRALDAMLSHVPAELPDGNVLVVVDQLEDLLTQTATDAQRAWLRTQLAAWLARDGVRLVVTVRSDYEPELRRDAWSASWSEGRFPVPPMTQDQLRRAIEEPAAARELYFKPASIVDDLINEVVQMPGALPLLSFTLSELYRHFYARRSDDRAITDADVAEVGGVTRALALRATGLVAELAKDDPAFEATAAQVMLRMVTTAGTEPARRRVPLAELVYDDASENARRARLVAAFVDARLLVADSKPDPYVEPAHDGLIRGWDRLAAWRQRAEAHLAVVRDAGTATVAWTVAKRDPRFLWYGDPRLPQVVALARHATGPLNRDERDFVTRSERRRRGRLATAAALVLAVLAVLTATTIYAVSRQKEADRRRRELATRLAHNWFRGGQVAMDNDRDVLLAFLSAARALAVAPDDDPRRASYFARLLALAPSTPTAVSDLGRLGRAAVDADHRIVVLQRIEGTLEVWDLSTRSRLPSPREPLEIRGGLIYPEQPVIRDDGRYAAVVTPIDHFVGGLRVLVWEVATGRLVVNEPAETIFSPTFGPAGWVARSEGDGLRLWNIEGSPASSREIPHALSLAPDTAARPLVAIANAGGLRFVDLADPTFTAGPFLVGESVEWHGWRRDGALLVETRSASAPARYWCRPTGCSAAATSPAPPRADDIEPCGVPFGPERVVVAGEAVIDIGLLGVPRAGMLCGVGDRLLALPYVTSGEWQTFVGIIECSMLRSRQCTSDEHERRVPGGFVAASWREDRRRLVTLSSRGLTLSWPSLVAPAAEDMVALPDASEREFGLEVTFDRHGRYAALAISDHAGITVMTYSLHDGQWSAPARIEFPTGDLSQERAADPHFIKGHLSVLRFDENAARLLITVLGHLGSSSTAIDPRTGAVTLAATATAGAVEDAILDHAGKLVEVVKSGDEDGPLRVIGSGAADVSCALPRTHLYVGLGRRGEHVILERSDEVVVWSLSSCGVLARVSAPAADPATIALVEVLLAQADEIGGVDGRIEIRAGGVNLVVTAEEGAMLIARGAIRLQLPPRPRQDVRVVPTAVSPDGRRLALVELATDRGPALQVWDLELGLRISGPDSPVVEGRDGASSLVKSSRWSVAFTPDGEDLLLLSRDRMLRRMRIGPARLPPRAWMRDLDVGVTGLVLREDGRPEVPRDAAIRMSTFRARVEAAARDGDRAAQALLRALP